MAINQFINHYNITMKIISHRGNLNGPDPQKENSPEYLAKALEKGFDVEIDIWLKEKEDIYLGHDEPTYLIDLKFILKHKGNKFINID